MNSHISKQTQTQTNTHTTLAVAFCCLTLFPASSSLALASPFTTTAVAAAAANNSLNRRTWSQKPTRFGTRAGVLFIRGGSDIPPMDDMMAASSAASGFGSADSALHASSPSGPADDIIPSESMPPSTDAPAPEAAAAPAVDEEQSAQSSAAADAEAQAETTLETTTSSSSKMGPKAAAPGFLRRLFPNVPWHTLPNLLTYIRCLAIPALVLQFYLSTHVNKNIHSSLIFAIASFTDYLDGYLARRWDICSPFGAFLDPVADKLMVSTALILLAGKYGSLVAIPTSIILAREISVSALREWMASKGLRNIVKVGFQGKLKTAATMVALTIVMAVPDAIGLKWTLNSFLSTSGDVWNACMNLGMAMFFLSSVVTVTSGSVYFKAAAPVLMADE